MAKKAVEIRRPSFKLEIRCIIGHFTCVDERNTAVIADFSQKRTSCTVEGQNAHIVRLRHRFSDAQKSTHEHAHDPRVRVALRLNSGNNILQVRFRSASSHELAPQAFRPVRQGLKFRLCQRAKSCQHCTLSCSEGIPRRSLAQLPRPFGHKTAPIVLCAQKARGWVFAIGSCVIAAFAQNRDRLNGVFTF